MIVRSNLRTRRRSQRCSTLSLFTTSVHYFTIPQTRAEQVKSWLQRKGGNMSRDKSARQVSRLCHSRERRSNIPSRRRRRLTNPWGFPDLSRQCHCTITCHALRSIVLTLSLLLRRVLLVESCPIWGALITSTGKPQE